MDAEKLIKLSEEESKRYPVEYLNETLTAIENTSLELLEKEFRKRLNNTFPKDNDNFEKIKFVRMIMNNNTINNIELIKNNRKINQASINLINTLKQETINKFIEFLDKEYTNDPTNEKKINRVNDLIKNIENTPDSMTKTITKELYNDTIVKLKKTAISVPTISPVSTVVPKTMSIEEYETQIMTILNQTFPSPNDNYRKISYIQDNSIEMIERAGMNDIESKKRYNIALNNISKKLESQIVDANIEYLNKKYQNDPTNIEKIKDLMDIKESFNNYTNIEPFSDSDTGTATILDGIKGKTMAQLLGSGSSSNKPDDISSDYLNYIKTIENKLEFHENLDSSLNYLFDYLKRENVNPNVLYEKVNYRNIEHQKLSNINKALDILFYSIFFSFILIMICTSNIKREDFLIYLLIGLIPVIYPFLFKFGKILIAYISPVLYGPKNAFVDIHNTVYEYDI